MSIEDSAPQGYRRVYKICWTSFGHLTSLHARQISGERWYEYGFELLRRCDQLWVLELEGWRESRGVQREIVIATSNGLTVVNIDPRSVGIDAQPDS